MKREALKKINEVAEEIGVAQYVLRFWEQEFSAIKPMRRNGRRLYNSSDISLLKKIKELLHNQGYTIKGVRKILKENSIDQKNYKECVKKSLSSLQEICDLISDKYGM
ncbi:MAG: MerR family transcriptional regulator [Rickettsiaceae bacterium H1]|nr:MerR family transcriptional regulator [Rickettsiaceae bacterium H1]